MKLLRYSEHSKNIEIAYDFIDNIDNPINESDESNKEIVKKICSDLKLNIQMFLTFGVGIEVMFPIINRLITNSKLNIELTPETIVLTTLAAFTIAYLEENKEMRERKEVEKDAKSMLEELKLKGVGNGIIKKLVSCIKSFGNIFKILFKNKRHVINGFFDMFAYTSILIPALHGISYMIGKYELNVDTLPSNFLSLGVGITTIAAKHGINYLIDMLKSKLKLNKAEIFKRFDNIEDPILKKYAHPEYIDTEYDTHDNNKLIKEND